MILVIVYYIFLNFKQKTILIFQFKDIQNKSIDLQEKLPFKKIIFAMTPMENGLLIILKKFQNQALELIGHMGWIFHHKQMKLSQIIIKINLKINLQIKIHHPKLLNKFVILHLKIIKKGILYNLKIALDQSKYLLINLEFLISHGFLKVNLDLIPL